MSRLAVALVAGMSAVGCDAAPRTSAPTLARSAALVRGAPSRAPWVAKAFAFMPENYYSYGVTVHRGAGGCASDRFIVANGYDHTPQFSVSVDAGKGCAPGVKVGASAHALHYADVVAGDFGGGDGREEVAMAVLAGPRETLQTGGLLLWASDGQERWIDRGFAASALAAGDVDLDGDLDLVVGTLWDTDYDRPEVMRATACDEAPPMLPLQPPLTAGVGSTLGFPFGAPPRGPSLASLVNEPLRGPALIYTQEAGGEFKLRAQLDAPAPARLRLADVDLDGDLDLLLAGTQVRVIHGPLLAPGKQPLACERLPWSGENPADVVFSPDLDVLQRRDAAGVTEVLVAASEGCYSALSCQRLERPGVVVWRRAASGAWTRHSTPIAGLPAALRFAWLDADDIPDLLVGRLTEQGGTCDCSLRPVVGELCLGAPLLVLRGAADPQGWRPGPPETLELRSQRSVQYPMSFRVLPHVNESLARTVHEVRQSVAAGARVVGFGGVGFVVGAAAKERATGRPVPLSQVYGDRHVTLRAGAGEAELTWRVARTTNYVLTSTSPLAGPTGGNLYVLAPQLAAARRGVDHGVE